MKVPRFIYIWKAKKRIYLNTQSPQYWERNAWGAFVKCVVNKSPDRHACLVARFIYGIYLLPLAAANFIDDFFYDCDSYSANDYY
ncbi:MAG: hypothetical protein WBA93_17960 [Microcoleaceae cyanobacterium]